MNNEKLITELYKIIHVYLDVAFTHDQSLKYIEHPKISYVLKIFHTDHIKHIYDLCDEIVKLGGSPPDGVHNLNGYYTTQTGVSLPNTNKMHSLETTCTNEILTNKSYKELLKNRRLPSSIRNLLEENYSVEKKHLEHIKNTLQISAI